MCISLRKKYHFSYHMLDKDTFTSKMLKCFPHSRLQTSHVEIRRVIYIQETKTTTLTFTQTCVRAKRERRTEREWRFLSLKLVFGHFSHRWHMRLLLSLAPFMANTFIQLWWIHTDKTLSRSLPVSLGLSVCYVTRIWASNIITIVSSVDLFIVVHRRCFSATTIIINAFEIVVRGCVHWTADGRMMVRAF